MNIKTILLGFVANFLTFAVLYFIIYLIVTWNKIDETLFIETISGGILFSIVWTSINIFRFKKFYGVLPTDPQLNTYETVLEKIVGYNLSAPFSQELETRLTSHIWKIIKTGCSNELLLEDKRLLFFKSKMKVTWERSEVHQYKVTVKIAPPLRQDKKTDEEDIRVEMAREILLNMELESEEWGAKLHD